MVWNEVSAAWAALGAVEAVDVAGEVLADGGRLVVNSGDFEVRRLDGGQVRVRCLEGHGELHHPLRTVALSSREEVTYDRQHLGERIQMVAAASNWRQGVVVFDDLPLTRVIDEINRYRPGRVVLMNDALAQRRFSAKFQIQALDDAIALMEDVLGVRVRRAGDLVIWHQALPHGPSPNRGTQPRLVQYINLAPAQVHCHDTWV